MRFIDTIEHGSNEESLPAEALSINSVYIENVIDGYRTLTVSGRETHSMDYDEKRIGDHTYMQNYYQDSRIIEVEYQVFADSPEELMQKYNVLNGLLNFKEAKLIFADESDKYYIGSKAESEAPPKGRLNVTSTFTIYCPDPHKYAVDEKEFQASINSEGVLESIINNEGTAEVPIDYTIKNNHDNGFLGVVTEDAVLQMGRISEVDEVPYQQSENLINTNDFSDWTRDTSTHPENSAKKTNGKLQMKPYSGQNILQLVDRGGTVGVNGGMISKEIPPDSEGIAGAKNFWCYFNAWFETGAVKQVSTMSINFLDENNELIFCYMIEKNNLNSNRAHVMLRGGGSQQHKYFDEYFEPSMAAYGKNMFDWQRGHADVVKMGSTLGGYYYGTRYSVDVPDLADKVCTKIQLYIGGYDTLPMVTGSAFRSLVFQKHNVDKLDDVPNRYPQDSTVEIDGHEGKIYTDGILRPDDEIRGSIYPLAKPGKTKVQFYYSDFADPKPDITAKIREGWL
jgi:predicted phage tail component-like protein